MASKLKYSPPINDTEATKPDLYIVVEVDWCSIVNGDWRVVRKKPIQK